jgi:hypothetical protein
VHSGPKHNENLHQSRVQYHHPNYPDRSTAGTKTLKYAIKADLTVGEATPAFNDPNSKKEGGFTVSAQKITSWVPTLLRCIALKVQL